MDTTWKHRAWAIILYAIGAVVLSNWLPWKEVATLGLFLLCLWVAEKEIRRIVREETQLVIRKEIERAFSEYR